MLALGEVPGGRQSSEAAPGDGIEGTVGGAALTHLEIQKVEGETSRQGFLGGGPSVDECVGLRDGRPRGIPGRSVWDSTKETGANTWCGTEVTEALRAG